jgi:hypothetical protein
MKFLILAFDAQLRVDLGSKEDGAFCNGMQVMTLLPWRLDSNVKVTCGYV